MTLFHMEEDILSLRNTVLLFITLSFVLLILCEILFLCSLMAYLTTLSVAQTASNVKNINL
jgi:hypothetical protein